MAKRFIDTGIFDDDWFMNLSIEAKLLWLYFITKCDHAGILKLNEKLCKVQTDINSLDTVIEQLGNRLVTVSEHLYFIPKFIEYQYPGFPNSNVKTQQSVLNILDKYNLLDDNKLNIKKLTVTQLLPNSYGYGYGNKGGMGETETTQINAPITLSMFDQFWELYPKKVDKGKALNNWKKICSKKTNERPTWKEIKRAILLQRKSERWQDKQFIPHPATWLNQTRWLDDPEEMKNIIRESNTPKIKYIDNIKCIWDEKTQHYHHAESGEVIFE